MCDNDNNDSVSDSNEDDGGAYIAIQIIYVQK